MKSVDTEAGFSQARAQRESAVSETRRNLILDAARSAFLDLGLDGASLREIAKRAGYTPGAIYTYFANLEEIYGALLSESLLRLKEAVDAAASHDHVESSGHALHAKARAFYLFYRDHPKDLDLGFYLFNGVRPRGLTPELNRKLNGQLLSALQPLQQSLEASGVPHQDAIAETTGIFAHIVGTLMLSNTGRIRLFGQDPDHLFERHMDAVVERVSARRDGAELHASQAEHAS